MLSRSSNFWPIARMQPYHAGDNMIKENHKPLTVQTVQFSVKRFSSCWYVARSGRQDQAGNIVEPKEPFAEPPSPMIDYDVLEEVKATITCNSKHATLNEQRLERPCFTCMHPTSDSFFVKSSRLFASKVNQRSEPCIYTSLLQSTTIPTDQLKHTVVCTGEDKT
jgi:hypothetical protein